MSDELSRVLIKKTGERYLVHRKARESYFVREMITNRFKKSCKEKRHKKKKNRRKTKSPELQINGMAENGMFKIRGFFTNFWKKEVWRSKERRDG